MSVSSSGSQSKTSNAGWKIIAIVFIILTVGASALAFYYYGQNQSNISNSVSNTADRNYYYSQWQSDENKIATLNQQISTDNGQIASDQSQIAQLQSGLYNPTCKPNCDQVILQLNAEINSKNVEIASDQAQIQSLNGQIANLQDILGLKKSQVIASGVTMNEPQCGEINQPSCQGSSACTNPANCTPQYILPSNFLSFCSPSCYQGVLVVSWTSTQSITIAFSSSYQSSGSISMSSTSTSSGSFAFPIIANFSLTHSVFTNGFHNDSCNRDNNGNYHCAALSLTYSETFDY